MLERLRAFRTIHVLLAILCLLVGFFFNRVVYSCGLFFAATFVVLQPNWWTKIKANLFLFSFALLPLPVLVSDLIHSPFLDVIIHTTFYSKLALLLLPLFIVCWSPSKQEVTWFHYALFMLLMVNLAYSLSHYFANKALVELLYRQAKVLTVLALKDHIRISWLIAISIWLAVYELYKKPATLIKYLLIAYIIAQVVYLHILSAKTGLLILYTSTFVFALYFGIMKKSLLSLVMIGIIIIAPVIAYHTIPSFYTRVGYVRWDIGLTLRGEMKSGFSDGSRIYSMKAGADLFKQNPMAGVGRINLKSKTYDWFAKHQPVMKYRDYILPSSQWLIYSAMIGIIGIIILLFHVLSPFLKNDFYQHWIFLTVYIPSVITLLYETHFEGQFSIFVYAFFMYWVYWLNEHHKQAPDNFTITNNSAP